MAVGGEKSSKLASRGRPNYPERMQGRGKVRGWGGIAIGLALIGAGCSSDTCEVVAQQLRACCAKGPAELRQSCENDADRLEKDGNSSACQSMLDHNAYQGCAP